MSRRSVLFGSTNRVAIPAGTRFQKQRAFTLIELMITMSLSLVFISGAIMFLASSRSLQDIQQASSRAQENARFAMDDLGVSIRMAGFYNELSLANDIPTGQFFLGRCGDYDPCTADGTDAQTYGSDRIAIVMNPPQDDGTDGDCVGNPLSDNFIIASDSVVVNLYRIQHGNSFNTLVCDSFLLDELGIATLINDEPYELVPGIDAMQLLYGVSDTEAVEQANYNLERYLSATDIDALTPPTGASTAWINLSSIRIALLAGSAINDEAAASNEQTHQLLNEIPITIQDKNFRKIYTSTVQINNARL